MHTSSLSFRLGRQSHRPTLSILALDASRHAPLAPRPPLRGDGLEPSLLRAQLSLSDERSWPNVPQRLVNVSGRSIVAVAAVLLLLVSPLGMLKLPSAVPADAPSTEAQLPTAAIPPTPPSERATPTAFPELLTAAVFEDRQASRVSLSEAFWTALDESHSRLRPPVRRLFPHRLPTPEEPSPYLMNLWVAPEWAEPEADAQADLHLLQHLPAQPPASGRITSRFGPRRAPHGAFAGRYQFHEGIDIAVFTGTPVVAPGPGTIVGVGFGHRFGRYVRIRHEAVGLETLFAHLSSVEPGIRYGTQVYRGQVVARSGNTGRSTGPHLHFEFRTVREQFPVDPFKVYTLYYQSRDRIAHLPIASTLAELPPYRIEDRLGIAAHLQTMD